MSSRIIRNNPIRVSLISLMISIDNFLDKTDGEDTGTFGAELKVMFDKLASMEDKYEQK